MVVVGCLLFWVAGGREKRKEKKERERVLRKRAKKRERLWCFSCFSSLVFVLEREIRFVFCALCYTRKRERERWNSIQRVGGGGCGGGGGGGGRDEERGGRRRTRASLLPLSLSSLSFTFFHSSSKEKKKNKTRRALLFALPSSSSSLKHGVLCAHELAQLLRDRGHDERQGRGAAPREARHDGRTSGRRAAPENVGGDEKGRLDIIGGDDDHDSIGPELVVDELFVPFRRSDERPLQRRVRDGAAGLGAAAQAVCPGGVGR